MKPQYKPRPDRIPPSPSDIERWLREVDPHLARVANEVIRRRGWPVQPADVDDIVQDVRIRLWSSDLEKYDEKRGKLIPFVVKRVFWEVADFVRKQSRASDRLDDLVAHLDDDEPCSSPEEQLVNEEYEQLLEDVVTWARQKLPRPLEQAAVLACVDDRTLNDVATKLQVGIWRVKQARKTGMTRPNAWRQTTLSNCEQSANKLGARTRRWHEPCPLPLDGRGRRLPRHHRARLADVSPSRTPAPNRSHRPTAAVLQGRPRRASPTESAAAGPNVGE